MKTAVKSIQPLTCQICKNSNLREVVDYASLCRITSDCRFFPAGGRLAVCEDCGSVQKIPDEKWVNEIGEIYAKYAAYYQADGDEQIVFDFLSGSPRRRSDVLMERLSGNFYLPKKGSALDIGCGNGVTLLAMSKVFHGWSLNGFELSENKLQHLNDIPGFSRLYTGAISSIDRSFDLTTMIHSLEHFPSPLTVLKSLHSIVNCGRLFVEVCNVEENPFDILIADHLMHFSPVSIVRAMQEAGFTADTLNVNWVQKEISLIAHPAQSENTLSSASTKYSESNREKIYNRMVSYVYWLKELVKAAVKLSHEGCLFGIFGTSIAATWLAVQLGKRISFFVDEDVSRVGKKHLGCPILPPEDVSPGSTVYLAMAPKVAEVIALRLAHLPFTSMLPPPLKLN